MSHKTYFSSSKNLTLSLLFPVQGTDVAHSDWAGDLSAPSVEFCGQLPGSCPTEPPPPPPSGCLFVKIMLTLVCYVLCRELMWHTLTKLVILLLPLLSSVGRYLGPAQRPPLFPPSSRLLVKNMLTLVCYVLCRELMWHTLTELVILLLPLLSSLGRYLGPAQRPPLLPPSGRLLCGICQQASLADSSQIICSQIRPKKIRPLAKNIRTPLRKVKIWV